MPNNDILRACSPSPSLPSPAAICFAFLALVALIEVVLSMSIVCIDIKAIDTFLLRHFKKTHSGWETINHS